MSAIAKILLHENFRNYRIGHYINEFLYMQCTYTVYMYMYMYMRLLLTTGGFGFSTVGMVVSMATRHPMTMSCHSCSRTQSFSSSLATFPLQDGKFCTKRAS